MGFRIASAVSFALLAASVMGATASAAEPSAAPAEPAGLVGPGLALLTPPAGTVAVVSSAAVPVDDSLRGTQTSILVVVGNGTTEPVGASVGWAATGTDGSLLWVGTLLNGYASINGALSEGKVPYAIAPGGFGLMLGSASELPADASFAFATRREDADDLFDSHPAVAVTSATIEDGHLVGGLSNASEVAIERGIQVVVFCLGAGGVPTAGTGSLLDLDAPIAAGGTAAFDVDLMGADCEDYVVGALGSS
jgi:hypothetical protein